MGFFARQLGFKDGDWWKRGGRHLVGGGHEKLRPTPTETAVAHCRPRFLLAFPPPLSAAATAPPTDTMPKSKRQRVKPLTKAEKKGNELKQTVVEAVRGAVDSYRAVFVFSFSNMRTNHFKQVRLDFPDSR
jgi:hypothetical protein